jgi:hypothetical protein
VLLAVGWKDKEADAAIAEVSVEEIIKQFPPPLPSSKFQHSMVEIFINFLSFLLLGIVAGGLGTLLFQIINHYFVDPLSSTSRFIGQVKTSAIHYAIASLIVGLPLYFWAEYFWFKRFSDQSEKTESRLSKWLTYIVLLLAAGTIIGDLITVIFNFLQGELSPRFYLKAASVLVIAGLIFGFYYLERKKIQYKKSISKRSLGFVAVTASFLAIVSIVLGFLAGGTPTIERQRQLDIATVQKLSNIASAVNTYALSEGALPPNLDELQTNPTYSYYFTNFAPNELADFSYRIIDNSHYELCGTFNLPTVKNQTQYYEDANWSWHEAGRACRILTATFRNQVQLKSTPLPAMPQ